eukprot:7818641-Pyramimonas_sp.AAC.1
MRLADIVNPPDCQHAHIVNCVDDKGVLTVSRPYLHRLLHVVIFVHQRYQLHLEADPPPLQLLPFYHLVGNLARH